jgi:hypothetical protein
VPCSLNKHSLTFTSHWAENLHEKKSVRNISAQEDNLWCYFVIETAVFVQVVYDVDCRLSSECRLNWTFRKVPARCWKVLRQSYIESLMQPLKR